MSEPTETYKFGFEQYQKLFAFLIHKAGGEVTVNHREFLDFPNDGYIESSIDVGTGSITVAYRPAK